MTNNTLFNLSTIAQQAMLEHGFIPGYTPAVIKETETATEPGFPLENFQAKDLRKLLWFSIDNDDSRDLDQLTHAEKRSGGGYIIRIAVACVDLLVKKDSAVDLRAANNTTSVYTPTKTFPMLPEKFSTDLTSLNPDEDRFAVIFEGSLSADGELESTSIYTAYVHNYAKLAYDAISNWLDGKPLPENVASIKGLEEQIRLQDSIAHILAKLRHSQGALSLETIEPHTVLDNGVPVAIDFMPKNRGRLLIENFMIIANTISAKYASNNNLAYLRRVVTVPRRWDKIIDIAKEYGTQLPETPDSVALEKFLVTQKELNPVAFPDLSLTIIKLLGNGEYKVFIPGKSTPGHFGLALRDYTHSTAPNRRYPDLIVQRILLASLNKKELPYSQRELENLASHCTKKEDEAEKIERRMRKSAAALVLSNSIGKEFDSIVTGTGEKGTWVRVLNPPVEGKLVKGVESVDVGDKIRVKLVHTDVLQGYIDFVRV